MFIVAWNFSGASQLFLFVSNGQSLVCLLGSEHSEGLSELLGKSEKSSFLKEERSMFHYPAAHMETVGGKDAEDSSTLTENSSQRFFFLDGVRVLGSTHMCHQAVGICKQHRGSWFVWSNPRCASCTAHRAFISEMPPTLNAPIVHRKDEKLNWPQGFKVFPIWRLGC